jgi:hypothetical protein
MNNRVDDSSILADWVCVSAETKEAFETDSGSAKAFTTVVLCGSAAGVFLPPMTIYSAKAVNSLWCERGPDRAHYQCSAKGWINEELFIYWFEKVFLIETAVVPRPVLLIMDNLSAHISIKAIEMAQKNQVILLCLPPNTTHALQPLDVVTFGSVLNYIELGLGGNL